MRNGILSFLIVLCISIPTVASSTPVPNIGIGSGESDSHTHLRFEGIPEDSKIVKVRTHLIVDQAAPIGLNFFAVQVNFPNQSWAHGGPQVNSGEEKANWGGLVNRGGGSKDYKEMNWKEDLLVIECGIEKPNTVPWKWNLNTEYTLTVERGKQIHLPAGTNHHFKVIVPARTMWEWKFTIMPVNREDETFSSLLYDSADHINSFYLWNEAGYGSTGGQQHSKWSIPTYWTENSAEEKAPSGWKRF